VLLLIYAATLAVAALVSNLARRSPLSTSILFLAVGVVVGRQTGHVVDVGPSDPSVVTLVDVAIVVTLFTDGMTVDLRRLRQAWQLPARALFVAMPLTFAMTAVAAHLVAGLPWTDAALLGAVLSPTDPVLAGAVVGRDEVPMRLRRLLNVESGLNDGLALPPVLVLLAIAANGTPSVGTTVSDVAVGAGIGVGVPLAVALVVRAVHPSITARYEPLLAAAVALLVYSACTIVGANQFLAAFLAGALLTHLLPDLATTGEFGQTAAEMLKLAGILVFGTLASPSAVVALGVGGIAFAVVGLVVARPVGMLVATLGTTLPLVDRLVVGWFGPKGFSSILYALFVVRAGIPHGDAIFQLAGLVVGGSILAHTTTDVFAVRWYARQARRAADARQAAAA
jgi:NhaP-type Na+/H+ or K+/H+ antiporter